MRASWLLWSWMISTYLSVLVSIFLDLFLDPSLIGNLMSNLLQKRHHKELGLFFNLRDTIHLKPFCTSIKPPSAYVLYCSHIWGGAPQSGGVRLLGRVQRRLVNLIGPVLSSNLPFALSQKSCSKSQLVLQVLPWMMFSRTFIFSSLLTLGWKINSIFWELALICCWYSQVTRNFCQTSLNCCI